MLCSSKAEDGLQNALDQDGHSAEVAQYIFNAPVEQFHHTVGLRLSTNNSEGTHPLVEKPLGIRTKGCLT